jgi:hypothetical protein
LDGAVADQLTLKHSNTESRPVAALPIGERLMDLTWSPDSRGVLVLSQHRVAGGTRSVIRWVALDGTTQELAALPGEPLPGSWVWAPDGQAVAFLVHAKTVALVALDVATGELRYLDDLRPEGLPNSGAVAPATWDQSGNLLYAAPARGAGFPSSTGSSAPVLYAVAPGRVDMRRVGDVEPVWAPVVRDDGLLLTLARADNDVLVLRPVDSAGHVLAEQRLGVRVSGAYSARWDLRHQQLLILRDAAAGGVDALLLRFGSDAGLSAATPEAGR